MTLLAKNDNQASATSRALLTGPSRAPSSSTARAVDGIVDARRLTWLTRSAREIDSGCGGWRFAGRFRSQGIRVHADPKPKPTLHGFTLAHAIVHNRCLTTARDVYAGRHQPEQGRWGGRVSTDPYPESHQATAWWKYAPIVKREFP